MFSGMNSDEFLNEEFENFPHFDDHLPCYGEYTDEDIVTEALPEEQQFISESSEDKLSNSEDHIPSTDSVFYSLSTLRKSFLPNNKFLKEIEDIEQYYFKLSMVSNVQSKITESFKNKCT